MSANQPDTGNGRLYCWEQVSRTNRLFRVSRVFAPRDGADRLLPLYGLFSVLEQISSRHDDEDVARNKLEWWRNECLRADRAGSQHPLVKELIRSGASSLLPTDSMNRLFDDAGIRIMASPPTDLESLKSLCINCYTPQLELELAVSAPGISASNFNPGFLARNGALQLFRESVQGEGRGRFWWVPLNLLARHGIDRSELTHQTSGPEVRVFLSELLSQFLSWGSQVVASSGTGMLDYSPARHVFALSGLYARKLKILAEASPADYPVQLSQLRPADLLEAWKWARRLG